MSGDLLELSGGLLVAERLRADAEKARADALEADCAAMRKALIFLHDTAGCQNGCDPRDMTCATNVAVAALAPGPGKRLLEDVAKVAQLEAAELARAEQVAELTAEVRAIEARLLQATMNSKKAESEHAAALAAKDARIAELEARVKCLCEAAEALRDVTGGYRG